MSNEQDHYAMTRRRLLQGAAAAGVTATIQPGWLWGAPQAANSVVQENQRPGTRDWMLNNTRIDPETRYRSPWIEGYS
jgi:hypothetical protein